jgi:hypothetical protein
VPSNADLSQLAKGVRQVASAHRVTFESVVGKRSALLEYAALMLAVERYSQAGYVVTAKNLQGGLFRIKKSSNGYPWRFSWYEVSRDGHSFELLTNAKVLGAFAADGGTYVVDVAVLKKGAIAGAESAGTSFGGFENNALRTFIESKALVVYPMLLAQFVGIVLEILPRFLSSQRRPRGHVARGHFDPTLVALGTFSANAQGIVKHYPRRKYRVKWCPDSTLRRQGDHLPKEPGASVRRCHRRSERLGLLGR